MTRTTGSLTLLVLLLCSCQVGRSGPSLQAAVARPFTDLRQGLLGDLLGRELRRNPMRSQALGFVSSPRDRVAALPGRGASLLGEVARDLGQSPRILGQSLGRVERRATQGFRRVGVGLASAQPQAWLARWLRLSTGVLQKLPQRILQSPGDLDRATDPRQAGDELGFLARLLRRF